VSTRTFWPPLFEMYLSDAGLSDKLYSLTWLCEVLVTPHTVVTTDTEPGGWLAFCCQGTESYGKEPSLQGKNTKTSKCPVNKTTQMSLEYVYFHLSSNKETHILLLELSNEGTLFFFWHCMKILTVRSLFSGSLSIYWSTRNTGIHMERKGFPHGPGLSVHTTPAHINTLHTQAKQHRSVNTDPCERPGFMELMGGCMGTFPGGSFCLFFWWRRRRRRPSSSHHEDKRAGKRAEEQDVQVMFEAVYDNPLW